MTDTSESILVKRKRSGPRRKGQPLQLATIALSGLSPALLSSVKACKTCSEALADAAEYVDSALNRHSQDCHRLEPLKAGR